MHPDNFIEVYLKNAPKKRTWKTTGRLSTNYLEIIISASIKLNMQKNRVVHIEFD